MYIQYLNGHLIAFLYRGYAISNIFVYILYSIYLYVIIITFDIALIKPFKWLYDNGSFIFNAQIFFLVINIF